ncbi:MAG: DUF4142 domain-containing protein [Syntrophobacteraceae bacterium]|jgi:putative membrane protein
MTTRSLKPLLFLVMAVAITFGFGAAEAREGDCEGAGQPDMTAFGFVAPVRQTCDKDFVRKAEEGYKLEVALGEKAAEQAANAEVKQFGRMVAKYNNFAGDQLLAIAKNSDSVVHTDMDRGERESLVRLSEMQGRDFDREYMNQVIMDYKDNVRLLEHMANEATDPDLRNYARQTIPALREHLRTALAIRGRIENQG